MNSLRSRLSLLFVLLFLLSFLAGLFLYQNIKSFEEQRTQRELYTLVAAVDEKSEDALRHALEIAEILKNSEAYYQEDCDEKIAAAMQEMDQFNVVGFVNAAGEVYCSHPDVTPSRQVADRQWFQEAYRTGDATIGEFQLSRTTGEANLVVATPVERAATGEVDLVGVGITLSWFSEYIGSFAEDSNLVVGMIDLDGRVLARYPQDGTLTGEFHPLADTLRNRLVGRSGAIVADGPDGIERVWAAEQIDSLAAPFLIYAGLPSAEGTLRVANRAGISIGVMAIIAVLVSGGGVFVTRKWLQRPLLQTTHFAQQIAAGNLGATLPTAAGLPAEVQDLYVALANMGRQIQKRTQALQEREALLARTERIANIGSWELDVVSDRVTWSKGMFRVLGLEPAQEAPPFSEHDQLFPPEEFARLQRAVDRAINTGTPYEMELRIIHASGEIRHCLVRGRAEMGQDGKAIELHGSFQDITELRQTEEALAESQRRLQAIFDHSQDAILLADDRAHYVDVNLAACKLTGYPREELLQMAIWDLTPEMNQTQGEAMWRQFLAAGESEGDFTIQNKDGRSIQTEFSAVANIVPGLHLSTNRDVTRQRQQQLDLKDTKSLLEKILTSLQEAVLVIDPQERTIITCNPAVEQVFGYDPDELVGQKTNALYQSEADFHRFAELSEPVLDRDGVFRSEYKMMHKNGTAIITNHTVSALEDSGEWREGVVSVVRDITDQKEAEMELVQRNEFIETILDNLPIGLAVNYIDEGKAAYMNAQFEEIYGWPREKLTDVEQFFRLVYPDPAYRAEIRAQINAALASGDPERMQWEDIEITTQQGEKRIISAKNIPIYEQNFMISTVQDITARSRAEAELQETNERLRAIIEASPVGIIVLTLEGRVTMWSPAAERIFGWSAEEIVGRPYPLANKPELATEFHHNLSQLAAGEVLGGHETRRQRKDGTVIDVMLDLAPVLDASGNVVAGMVLISDISTRKRSEAQLIEHARRLETLHEIDRAILAQNSPEEIATVVVEHIARLIDCRRISAGLIDESDDTATVLAVFVANGPTSMQPGQTVPLGDNKAALSALRRGATHAFPDLTEYSTQSPVIRQLVEEGLRSYMTVPLLAGGHLIGTLSLGFDEKNAFDESHELFVTEVADQLAIALQQTRLLEAERTQRLLAETLQQTAVTLGGTLSLPETLDAILNQLALVVGYDLAQVLLIEREMLTVGAQQGPLANGAEMETARPYTEIRALRRALQSGAPILLSETEISHNHPDLPGVTPTLTTWMGVPLIARDVTVGFLTVGSAGSAYHHRERRAIDAFAQQAALAIEKATILTELQNSLRQLQEAQARLLQAARLSAIGETAAGVAHQINNPLMTVVVDSHLLTKNLPADHPARASAVAINQAARRAARIVERLLDFSQTEPTGKTAVDIGDSIKEAVTLVTAQLPREITLSVRAEADLPPVQASPDHLQDVWLNLLLNARDAILPAGGGKITVDVLHNADEQQIEVAIADDGIGIPAAEQSNLFTPFYTTKAQGTGLGLAVCTDIIEHHDGAIRVQSVEGEGSIFTVVLPISTVSSDST